MKVKPFLRWAGGKQNHVDLLLKNAPEHNNNNSKYFEPFLGAGSLFFSNGFKNAYISDINPQLINSYKQIKIDYESVFRLLIKHNESFQHQKDYYYEVRSLFNGDKNEMNLIQASRFIFLIHSNYNGMYRVNKNGGYNVPVGKLKPALPSLDHLKAISNKLKSVTINCGNYNVILNLVKSGDFIYLDPPYPPYNWDKTNNQYTINHFSKKNHQDLSDFANKLVEKGCNVLLSYPDIPFVQETYDNWNIAELNSFRSISCKKERIKIPELIIKSY